MKPQERLKVLREELGFTQTKMAEKLRMQLTSYNNIERGKNQISPRVSLLIQLLFGVNEKWLMEGLGEKFAIEKYTKSSYQDFQETLDSSEGLSVVGEKVMTYSNFGEYKLEEDDFKNPEFLKIKYTNLLKQFLALKEDVSRYKKIIDKLT